MGVELQPQTDPAAAATAGPACRFCAAPLRHTFVDLGMSPLCESYVAADRAQRHGAVLSAARAGLRALPARAARGVRRRPRTSSREYAYFSSYSDSWVAARPPLRRRWRSSASAWPRTASSSRSPATTATCCSTSSSAASRRSASSRPRTSPRPPQERGVPTLVAFFGARAAPPTSSREGKRADLIAGQQRAGARAGPQRLRRRHRDRCSPTDGVVDARVPAPAAADRGQPVRHDLPRALLVLLAASPRRRSSPRHGLSVFDVEELRRTAARCASTRSARRPARGRSADRVAASSPTRERALGFDTLEGHLGFAAQVEETKWSLLEFLIAQAPRGQARRRLRRAGQGQHAAQLLRHPHRPARLHGRPQPVQAGPLPARDAHPDPPAGAARARPARLHPDPARGTSRRRSWRSSQYAREWGAQFVVPIPQVEVAVKVVLFCGGQGLRMREASERRSQADDPGRQPADPVARDEVLRPLRVHTTSCSASATRPRSIKEFFLNYNEALANDFVLSRGRREGPAAQDRHRRLEHHVRRHRPALDDRRAAAARARHLLRDDEMFLANYGDTVTDVAPARDDRARSRTRTRWRSFLARQAELQLPRRRRSTTTGACARSATSRVRHVDQRRLLRHAPRDLRRPAARARSSSRSRSSA